VSRAIIDGMTPDTFERVQRRLATQLKVAPETIEPDQRLDALGVDSLTALELVFDLEQDFRISIPTDQEKTFTTVREICDAIEQLVAKAR
jgi:acyl carrier protein